MQIETLAKAVAVLTACLELEINVLTVTTHCEAALFDGYGPHSGDPQLRWDLWYLPDLPLDSVLKPGGYVIRGKEMAITKTVTKQTLTLNVEDGVNSQGAAKTKGHNYAGVRPEAEPAAIMQAAAAFGTLISHELMGVVVTEKAELAQ